MPIWSTKPKPENPYYTGAKAEEVPPQPARPAPQKSSTNGRSAPQQQRQNSQQKPRPASQQGSNVTKPKLVFHCQQAHGSPTGIISGFTSIKELYEKIAECYDFESEEILFCTLNTHKADMNNLLGGQIGLEDFIFAHRKGQAKEIDIIKTEDALGLTITDNGAGYCFIKKIREGSVIDQISHISVGDHIERIGDENLVGKKHFEVAKLLKDIPKGTEFTMRLVEPLKAGFANIGPRSNAGSSGKKSYGSGKETLRLRSSGPATVETAPDDVIQAAVDKINNLLESFMGINDTDLATQIWELGQDKSNPIEMTDIIETSELSAFGFTEDFIFDVWGIISDAKAGRLPM